MEKEFYSSRSFPLLLSNILEGDALFLTPPTGVFNFHYNIRTQEGQAQLLYLNESTLALTLYPAIENNLLIFTTNIQPTAYTMFGNPIVLNKVLLKIDLENNVRSAAMLFNHKGDVIYTTPNYTNMRPTSE